MDPKLAAIGAAVVVAGVGAYLLTRGDPGSTPEQKQRLKDTVDAIHVSEEMGIPPGLSGITTLAAGWATDISDQIHKGDVNPELVATVNDYINRVQTHLKSDNVDTDFVLAYAIYTKADKLLEDYRRGFGISDVNKLDPASTTAQDRVLHIAPALMDRFAQYAAKQSIGAMTDLVTYGYWFDGKKWDLPGAVRMYHEYGPAYNDWAFNKFSTDQAVITRIFNGLVKTPAWLTSDPYIQDWLTKTNERATANYVANGVTTVVNQLAPAATAIFKSDWFAVAVYMQLTPEQRTAQLATLTPEKRKHLLDAVEFYKTQQTQ